MSGRRDFARTLLNLKRGNGKEDFSNLCSKLQPVFIDFTFCTTAKGGYRTYLLHPEITVSDIHQTREVRSTAPLQIFSKDALKNLNALQVSDAVKHFAGVTVKDYGGSAD
ncbi:hypothetical protein BFINE_28880 [Bacteroides finegoldii DSM 17565]|nr:hypothetical protein BFINE_28880 [Bacteroides finegoldii DSM 17565]